MEQFKAHVLENIRRIQKKLGGDLYTKLNKEFSYALRELETNGTPDFFRNGIRILLTEYYDPMYDYMQSKRMGEVLFRGQADELISWANALE